MTPKMKFRRNLSSLTSMNQISRQYRVHSRTVHSSLTIFFTFLAVAIGVSQVQCSLGNGNANDGNTQILQIPTKMIRAICQPTDYKKSCIDNLSAAANTTRTNNPKDLIKSLFEVTMAHISEVVKDSSSLKVQVRMDHMSQQALQVCNEVLDYAIKDLKACRDQLGDDFDIRNFGDDLLTDDLKIRLTAAMTYQDTCLDGFQNTPGDVGLEMDKALTSSRELASNTLAVVTEISPILNSLKIQIRRPPLREESLPSSDGFPPWITLGKRKLLQAVVDTKAGNIVVVSKDGANGAYRTINEALKEVPRNNNKTFIIYVKEGVYEEQVEIGRHMTHVMMIGDGPTRTKITGSKNVIDGTGTYRSATVAVVGNGFIARDIGFENSAGPEKHQAVALRVESDRSIFYNCLIDGYQDTLYPHSNRQFYRDCTISGTVDFIFGNAAAVFQNCKIVLKKPLQGQSCTVTAHGRNCTRQPTGFVFQNCAITADPLYIPLKNTIKSYLGRPWRAYSRTVIMESDIDDVIDPEGWSRWDGDFGVNTCFYAEYNNIGPGSDLSNRVNWPGFKKLATQEAENFIPMSFIKADRWLKHTGVPYTTSWSKTNLTRPGPNS